MFWNKNKNREGENKKQFKDGSVAQHGVMINQLINEKMSAFREQVIEKDDVLKKEIKLLQKDVANYSERTCNNEVRITKLTENLQKLCTCKHVNITREDPPPTLAACVNIKDDGTYSFFGMPYSIYQKACTVCGSIEYITKKQHLTYQKETIESSLKECE